MPTLLLMIPVQDLPIDLSTGRLKVPAAMHIVLLAGKPGNLPSKTPVLHLPISIQNQADIRLPCMCRVAIPV